MSSRWMLIGCLSCAVLALATVLGLGQSGERPRPKLFGGGAVKTGAVKAGEVARRKTEIDVELAWLADPITFPYFLEAHVEGTTLTVRGYVPDKAVREHAMKLARLHTPLTIADTLKEHPSLLVRVAKEAPGQLQSAVAVTLREALPRQYKQVQVQCAADGTVILRGPLASAEDRLTASHALRRLYGCTSVQNLTRLPGAPDLATAKATPLLQDNAKRAVPPVASIGLPVPSQVPAPAPEPSKAVPPPAPRVAVAKEAPKTAGKLAMSAEKTSRLQKRILEACPGAKGVKIEVTPLHKLQIELTVRSDTQIPTFAGTIYSLPELVELREDVELHFSVGQ